MHEGSLEISANNMVDMTNVKIPCDGSIMEGNLCGVITYIDPMEKCMDVNVTNNLVITPVYVNYSDCSHSQYNNGQCSTHVDFMKKGNGYSNLYFLYQLRYKNLHDLWSGRLNNLQKVSALKPSKFSR